MPTDTLTTLLSATGGAFLGKFVGPAAESLGKAAWERAQQLGTKATAYLASVGREPQPVELKLLLPLVQAASLEADETLSNHWASLLANVADPIQYIQVQPAFADLLRQLTRLDAQILRAIAEAEPIKHPHFGYVEASQIFAQFTGMPPANFPIALGNLARLGLCLNVAEQGLNIGSWLTTRSNQRSLGPGFDYLQVTPFGRAFLAAVSPPKS